MCSSRQLSLALSSSAAIAVLAMALGCGGQRMRTGALYQGRVDAPPSLECMPDPDVPYEELSERMRIGLQLAEASFAVPAPDPPISRAALDLQEWSEGPLRAWLRMKTHAIEQARRELDVAAEESHRQRIIGGAVVGLMYEDVARVLGALPVPDDLDDEPEILEIYQQVLRSQARPFVETARRAYRACALNARQPDTMSHWSHFCAGREDRLPEGEGPAPGRTEVDVLVE